MSEQMKYLVAELNKSPYDRNYNLISFDALQGDQLLQILSDVLAEIDAKNKIDIREEEPESTVIRILGMLRILKYKPPDEISHNFRQGLVEGHKQVIYPVLEWLLSHIPELKKRAYLAKYLVKVDLPPEVAADPDVSELYDQYDTLIEDFKNVHKELEAIKNSGYSTIELRKDIEEMEKEKDIVEKRIERMQRKVEGAPNVEVMMEAVKQLRAEKEKQKELLNQRSEQRIAIQQADQRIIRMEQQLKDLRAAAMGATPEALLQKIEEETKVNTYIVMQKLPKEIDAKRKMVENLQKVIDQPALGQDDILDLKDKIKIARTEIEELTSKKNVSNDPMEDKLTLFRQRAAIIARKKESTAEKLNDARNELSATEEEISEKRQQVQSFAGETVLRGDDFKRYVASLRGKSNTYKKKRAELSEYRAEFGVLSRTFELIQGKNERLQQSLSRFEAERGISGFRDTKSHMEAVEATASGLDVQKGQTLEDMSGMVHQLSMKIAERKSRLAPIIKELRPLRQQVQDREAEYEEKKHAYDTLSLQLESSMSRVEQEVKKFQEEILANETRHQLLELRNRNLELLLQRAHDEIKLYVSNKAEDKKKSVREQLLKQIADQEKRGKAVKEEQKKIKDSLTTASKQMKLWTNLERLLACKKQCLENAQKEQDMGTVHIEPGTETLVLQ